MIRRTACLLVGHALPESRPSSGFARGFAVTCERCRRQYSWGSLRSQQMGPWTDLMDSLKVRFRRSRPKLRRAFGFGLFAVAAVLTIASGNAGAQEENGLAVAFLIGASFAAAFGFSVLYAEF